LQRGATMNRIPILGLFGLAAVLLFAIASAGLAAA
jgi:hypothetical protein